MTRKEAIKVIKIIEKRFITLDKEERQALILAIKALEQEPCEDAVSRRVVIDGLASIAKVKAKSDAQKSLMGRVMFFTEQLPPVTPKQRTGKIIMGGYDCDHYICSECGHDFGWFSKPDYNYCPHCGAKMEGESE